MKKLIVDCNNLCHIAANALPDLSLEEFSTEVTYGFLSSIFLLQKEYNPDEQIFCWDSKKSFRKLVYPQYKARRRKNLSKEERERLDVMFGQFTDLRKYVLPELGFKNIFMQTGYEGDDLIANIVYQYPEQEFYIISTDKDLFQLLNKNIMIYNPITKKGMTPSLFKKKYNIDKSRWVEVKAIAGEKGETSDNIAGVEGVGEKTAIKYLKGELPEHHKTYKAITSELGRKLQKINFPLVKLPYKGRTEIRTELKDQPPLLRKDFRRIFQQYEFNSFLKPVSFEKWALAFDLR